VLGALTASLQSGLGIIFWAIAGIAVASAAISLVFPDIPVTSTTTPRGDEGQPAEMTTVPPEA
jgi:Na+/H+ antiporter NhaD/arsenite permease-like protein